MYFKKTKKWIKKIKWTKSNNALQENIKLNKNINELKIEKNNKI